MERAAQAVENAIFNPALKADISIICDDPGRVHRAIARAVLLAIREPSHAMEMAAWGNHKGDPDYTGCSDNPLPDEAWERMIDAALSEGEAK